MALLWTLPEDVTGRRRQNDADRCRSWGEPEWQSRAEQIAGEKGYMADKLEGRKRSHSGTRISWHEEPSLIYAWGRTGVAVALKDNSMFLLAGSWVRTAAVVMLVNQSSVFCQSCSLWVNFKTSVCTLLGHNQVLSARFEVLVKLPLSSSKRMIWSCRIKLILQSVHRQNVSCFSEITVMRIYWPKFSIANTRQVLWIYSTSYSHVELGCTNLNRDTCDLRGLEPSHK